LVGRNLIPLSGPLGNAEQTIESIIGQAMSVTKLIGITPPFTAMPIGETKVINRLPGSPSTWQTLQSPSPIIAKNADDSDLNRGGVVASDDEYLWLQGGVWAQTGTGHSLHCRATDQSNVGPQATLNRPITCYDQSQDTHHHYGGIAPYMSYQANVRSGSFQDFNQPDVLFFTHKTPAQAGFGQPINFTVNSPNGPRAFDTTIGRHPNVLNALTGILTIARAQVYYHRPGNWQEPPNLFNPFWRAHLAPVADALNNVPGVAGLGQEGSDLLASLNQFMQYQMFMH
jgi:hypothetical protein